MSTATSEGTDGVVTSNDAAGRSRRRNVAGAEAQESAPLPQSSPTTTVTTDSSVVALKGILPAPLPPVVSGGNGRNMLHVTVVGGAGNMGARIATEFAISGHTVVLQDLNVDHLRRTLNTIEVELLDFAQKRVIMFDEVKSAVSRLSVTVDLKEAVSKSDIIVEAIVENLLAKQEIFGRISKHCSESAIIVTTSVSLSITDIAIRVSRPQRTLGMRFLWPVHLIPEVELSPGQFTSSETTDNMKTLLLSMGKNPYFKGPGHRLVLNWEQARFRQEAALNELLAERSRIFHRRNDNEPADGGKEDKSCIICFEGKKDALIYPCGHISCCMDCGQILKTRGDKCPVCRGDIYDVVRPFIV